MSTRKNIITSFTEVLETLTISNGYSNTIKEVSRYPQNVLLVDKSKIPLLIIDDKGEDLIVEDSTNCRYKIDIDIVVLTESSSMNTAFDTVQDILADIRYLAGTAPDIDDSVLRFKVYDATTIAYDYDKKRAWAIINADILYTRSKSGY